MKVAANRGLVGDIFTTEAEAIAWLDAQRKQTGEKPPGSST